MSDTKRTFTLAIIIDTILKSVGLKTTTEELDKAKKAAQGLAAAATDLTEKEKYTNEQLAKLVKQLSEMQEVGKSVSVGALAAIKTDLKSLEAGATAAGISTKRFTLAWAEFHATEERARGISKEFKELQASMKGVGEEAGQAAPRFGALQVAFGNLLSNFAQRAVDRVFEFFKEIPKHLLEIGEQASQLDKLATKAGVSVSAMARWSAAAKEQNVSSAQLSQALRFMNRAIDDASKGTGQAHEAFTRLGKDFYETQIQGKTSEQAFDALAKRFGTLPPEVDRAALAIKIFGRSGTEILPALTANFEEATQEAEKFGLTSASLAREGSTLHANLVKVGHVTEGLWNTVAEKLLPVVNDVVGAFVKWYETNGSILRQKLGDTIQEWGDKLSVLTILALKSAAAFARWTATLAEKTSITKAGDERAAALRAASDNIQATLDAFMQGSLKIETAAETRRKAIALKAAGDREVRDKEAEKSRDRNAKAEQDEREREKRAEEELARFFESMETDALAKKLAKIEDEKRAAYKAANETATSAADLYAKTEKIEAASEAKRLQAISEWAKKVESEYTRSAATLEALIEKGEKKANAAAKAEAKENQTTLDGFGKEYAKVVTILSEENSSAAEKRKAAIAREIEGLRALAAAFPSFSAEINAAIEKLTKESGSITVQEWAKTVAEVLRIVGRLVSEFSAYSNAMAAEKSAKLKEQQDKETQALEDDYQRRIDAAERLGKSTTDIEKRKADALVALEKKQKAESLKLQKQAFEDNKKYQYASTIIAGAAGIAQIWADPTGNWVTKIAMTIVEAASIALQLATISATKFHGSAKGGAYNVPEDQPVLVHKGEMIVPPQTAAEIRSAWGAAPAAFSAAAMLRGGAQGSGFAGAGFGGSPAVGSVRVANMPNMRGGDTTNSHSVSYTINGDVIAQDSTSFERRVVRGSDRFRRNVESRNQRK